MTLKEAAEILSSAGIEDGRAEARRIFRAVGKFADYELVRADFSTELYEVLDAVRRRALREPLQYIIGEADFYRETYKVTPDCLIPRSDTEILVDFAVKNLTRGASFLDLCTGSGCVGVSVLNNTEGTSCTAVDISEGALTVAAENAKRYGVAERFHIVRQDAVSLPIEGSFFAVLSNPPYVTEQAYEGLAPEIYHEPRAAFVGGRDGGDFYRALTPMYRDRIEDDGFIAYEIGYDQKELIENIAKENLMSCEILYDLSGNPRVSVLKKIKQ